MARDQIFTCQACGAEFDSREQMEAHNVREHGQAGRGSDGGSIDAPRQDEPGGLRNPSEPNTTEKL